MVTNYILKHPSCSKATTIVAKTLQLSATVRVCRSRNTYLMGWGRLDCDVASTLPLPSLPLECLFCNLLWTRASLFSSSRIAISLWSWRQATPAPTVCSNVNCSMQLYCGLYLWLWHAGRSSCKLTGKSTPSVSCMCWQCINSFTYTAMLVHFTILQSAYSLTS